MADFIRARSPEQKCQRMDCIKAVALRQFNERSYHQITLTTIAEELGWSRANLYKYVTTKEEIFLELSADARNAYMDELLEVLPCPESPGAQTSHDAAELQRVARDWARVAARHSEWFRLGDLLFTIIETNVTVERLAEFKRGYYEKADVLAERVACITGQSKLEAEHLLNTVYYHAVGMTCNCMSNPLVREALERIGHVRELPDLEDELADFIAMCLEHAHA